MSAKTEQFERLLLESLRETIQEHFGRAINPGMRRQVAAECESFLRSLVHDKPKILPAGPFVEVFADEVDKRRVWIHVDLPYSDELADRLWNAGIRFNIGGRPYTREYTFTVDYGADDAVGTGLISNGED